MKYFEAMLISLPLIKPLYNKLCDLLAIDREYFIYMGEALTSMEELKQIGPGSGCIAEFDDIGDGCFPYDMRLFASTLQKVRKGEIKLEMNDFISIKDNPFLLDFHSIYIEQFYLLKMDAALARQLEKQNADPEAYDWNYNLRNSLTNKLYDYYGVIRYRDRGVLLFKDWVKANHDKLNTVNCPMNISTRRAYPANMNLKMACTMQHKIYSRSRKSP